MTPKTFRILLSSIKFYWKPVFYQVLIIALLSAVISGSLLTGESVKNSLKRSASERLGNTGVLVSSGIRFFDIGLADRIDSGAGTGSTGLLEIIGYSQSLSSQKGAFNTHIYGIGDDFFPFHGVDSVILKQGEALINRRLADHLELNKGDEIIIRYNEISDIPADAPFAPAAEEGKSFVMKIGSILEPEQSGNFSLMISQITPMNIFLKLSDLQTAPGKPLKINRLLIDKKTDISATAASELLKKVLKPSDAGLRVRTIVRTGDQELLSDRVFIDLPVINEISGLIPSASQVITYLANRIKSGTGSAPYSFVSAIPSSLYPEITSDNDIIINNWLAEDLKVGAGDSIQMYWFSPDSLNKLVEKNDIFIVKRVVKSKGIWADSLLMPDFPGIAGSESCSEWDAGVPIRMDEIRDKDEEYWTLYKGTPKAFINYEKGREIWGSNYGPATSIRFQNGLSSGEIESRLEGSLDPAILGFSVSDIAGEAINAADESVDFGTLFLSLGFFLIVASIVLLSFAVSYYFDTKQGIIKTYYALGFTNKWIERLLFYETSLIGAIGCFIGAFAGYLVNVLITGALNSVWQGAVQTNTLSAYFDIIPVLTGFVITILLLTLFMRFKTNNYLRSLNRREKDIHRFASPRYNLIYLLSSAILTILLLVSSLLFSDNNTAYSFGAGAFLLITFILFWRQLYIGRIKGFQDRLQSGNYLSRLYYSYYPSHAVTPILFIAAGLFAVFITGVNRMDFDEKLMNRASGTGGYLLWCESNIPITDDPLTAGGRKSLGLDDESLSAMTITTMKRSSGNDASCLNLNHITSPPLLGADPEDFISRGAFSFAKVLKGKNGDNPWNFLSQNEGPATIYGIADQTVLDWGLKLSVGDTLILRAETGQKLNIILAAGLKSSIFQGYVIVSKENFTRYFPSVSGTSLMLVDGDQTKAELYQETLNERLSAYGLNTELTPERLKSFYAVTNTYLSVFGVFGAFGMITGVAGMGFIILRNYNRRKREFALMLATGFTIRKIRRSILSEQIRIIVAGVIAGSFSAIIATLPSLMSGQEIPWFYLLMMILAITITGFLAVYISVKSFTGAGLISSLKKE
jgi:ABC-type antimicrobial peptide transport system permease subunit